MTEMASGEFALIKKYFAPLGATDNNKGIAVGIGDDAAVLNPSPGTQIVMATDTLVAGIHFPVSASGAAIARRALRVNLSDMAAMGALPKWFTLALTLPVAEPAWLEAFTEGMAKDAKAYGCSLIGGDTTRGPLTVTIQMLGEVPAGQALTRAGAKPGDKIYVTGNLGAAAAALAYLEAEQPSVSVQGLLKRYYLPEPRISEGLLLRGLASSAIDISDGLLADLGHILASSGAGARLWLDKLPLFPGLEENQALLWGMTGGDDYELCFTVPAGREREFNQLLQTENIVATAIGEIVAGSGVVCLDSDGRWVPVDTFLNTKSGYQHF